MKRIFNACIIILTLIIYSCTRQEYTPEKLNSYVQDEENGLIKKSQANGYVAEVFYRPTDLLVAQERDPQSIDHGAITALQNKYEPYYYFVLNLSKDNKEALHMNGQTAYSELVQTLSFGMGQYVNLTSSSQDTIPTADFILNRTFGLSNATSLLFVFSKEKAKDREWVQFNLNEFGLGLGNQRFRFLVKDLERVPRLNFSLPSKAE